MKKLLLTLPVLASLAGVGAYFYFKPQPVDPQLVRQVVQEHMPTSTPFLPDGSGFIANHALVSVEPQGMAAVATTSHTLTAIEDGLPVPGRTITMTMVHTVTGSHARYEVVSELQPQPELQPWFDHNGGQSPLRIVSSGDPLHGTSSLRLLGFDTTTQTGDRLQWTTVDGSVAWRGQTLTSLEAVAPRFAAINADQGTGLDIADVRLTGSGDEPGVGDVELRIDQIRFKDNGQLKFKSTGTRMRVSSDMDDDGFATSEVTFHSGDTYIDTPQAADFNAYAMTFTSAGVPARALRELDIQPEQYNDPTTVIRMAQAFTRPLDTTVTFQGLNDDAVTGEVRLEATVPPMDQTTPETALMTLVGGTVLRGFMDVAYTPADDAERAKLAQLTQQGLLRYEGQRLKAELSITNGNVQLMSGQQVPLMAMLMGMVSK